MRTELARSVALGVVFLAGLGGDLRLVDSETREVRELTLDGEGLRAYRQRVQEFLAGAEGFCRSLEIGYRHVVTDAPIEEFMLAELKGLILT